MSTTWNPVVADQAGLGPGCAAHPEPFVHGSPQADAQAPEGVDITQTAGPRIHASVEPSRNKWYVCMSHL
jgi:hypothetical protein